MKTESIVKFDRKFQIWLYSVSHGQLLLRSPKGQNYQSQVDVLFKNVAFIQLPALFNGLAISELSLTEFEALNLSSGLLPVGDRKCFKLEGDGWRGVVVAGHIAWTEDNAEHSTENKLIS
jgi:hypothetical protein